MQPANGIVGEDFGINLPQMEVDDKQLEAEKSMAKFSKSSEFQKLKEHLESRIDFYQSFLPDGRPVVDNPTVENWVIANAIIGEFKAVIAAYERAGTAMQDEAAKDA